MVRKSCLLWLAGKDWLGLVVTLARLAGLIGLKRFVVFVWMDLFGCSVLIGWKRLVVFDWLILLSCLGLLGLYYWL